MTIARKVDARAYIEAFPNSSGIINHVVIGTVKKPITEETKGPMENPRNRLRKVRALSAIYKKPPFLK